MRKIEPLRYRRNDSLDGLFYQGKADTDKKPHWPKRTRHGGLILVENWGSEVLTGEKTS